MLKHDLRSTDDGVAVQLPPQSTSMRTLTTECKEYDWAITTEPEEYN
jgi:hypothetical protein